MSTTTMNIGKACAIFQQIDSGKYTVEEKGTAILEVLKMPTHNGVTKAAMLRVINFLLCLAFDVPEQEAKTCAGGCDGKAITKGDIQHD